MRSPFGVVFLILCIPLAARAALADVVTYAEVAPIFAKSCVLCHAGEAASAGLRLDSLEGILAGATRGSVVESGDAEASELIRRVRGISMPRMPLTGPPYLSDGEIALLESWVAGGLREGAPVAAAGEPAASVSTGGEVNYRHVAPILAARCVKCHAERGLMGEAPEGFVLTSYESAMASSDRARVVPGNPGASELLRRIRGESLPRMPLDGPPYLDAEQIGLIAAWIAAGARDAAGGAAPNPVGARVRLHGTLTRRWTLDDLDLVVGSGTRIDKSPAPGDYVEVRGRIGGGGEVTVERLRPR